MGEPESGDRRLGKNWKGDDFRCKDKTWSDLGAGEVSCFAHSLDYKYVYYVTMGPEPKAMRIRLADRKIESIADLKDFPMGTGRRRPHTDQCRSRWLTYFTRNIGTQEIYALTVKWP